MHHTHILMLATVSLFTGMIAPCVSGFEKSIPYALTNMQYVAYGILILIVLVFWVASIRMRNMTNILSGIIVLLIIVLCIVTLGGLVQSSSGEVMRGLSWGWVFLCAGSILTFFGLIRTREYATVAPVSGYDIMIGSMGMILLWWLSFFIIAIAEIHHQRIAPSFMEQIFGADQVYRMSGAILSPAYDKIDGLHVDRSTDRLYFLGDREWKKYLYPQGVAVDGDITDVHVKNDQQYLFKNNGEVLLNNQSLGYVWIQWKQSFAIVQSTNTILFVTPHTEYIYAFIASPKMMRLSAWEDMLFWVDWDESGERVYKNWEPISPLYKKIHAFNVSDDWGHWMAAVDMYEYPEMVSLVQDGVFQSTLRSSRVLGTLAMNGMHSLYQLKNEDGSISIVFDDIVLDKKLDEIRETYIDLHGGYAYFGRLQGETQYCLFTRYKGDICGLDGYMNPFQEADGEYIVFAGLKKGVWSLYRGITPFIASMGYENRGNISHDYFFADNTQPRYYMFVEHTSAWYRINKQGVLLPEVWKDVWVDQVFFGYDGKVFMPVLDDMGWRVAEI